jgi:hypothetical protein
MNAIPNRRGLLLGALTAGAAASVVAMPAIAAAEPADPVFGLVEAHKLAWASFMEIFNFDDHEAVERAAGAADAALDAIMKTPPTTRAGARSAIEYLVGWDEDGAMETGGRYLATLLRSPILTPKEERT